MDTSPLAANEVVTIAGILPGMFVPVGANPNPLADFPFEFSQGEKLTRSVAGYGALSYTFADVLTIRGEIRYTNERKTLTWQSGATEGRIRVGTEGRGHVQYDVRAGHRYAIQWSNQKGVWDVACRRAFARSRPRPSWGAPCARAAVA